MHCRWCVAPVSQVLVKISSSYCGYLLPYFGNLISQVAANRVIWIQLLAEMHMKSEVFVGQSLFNVHSTAGLSGEGWDRGALGEWLASSGHLAGCSDGSPQCWQTKPRAVGLPLHPSCPVGTRVGHLTYGSCRDPEICDHLCPESSFASVCNGRFLWETSSVGFVPGHSATWKW